MDLEVDHRARWAHWAEHAFNPWLSLSRVLGSAKDPSGVVDAFSARGDPAAARAWNVRAAKHGRRDNVFAGPWCRALTDECDAEVRDGFWRLVQETPALDWLLLIDDIRLGKIFVPRDWDEGYANCWVGVKLTGPVGAPGRLEMLRQLPAQHRFALASPMNEDLGVLDLRAIDRVIVHSNADFTFDNEAVMALRLACLGSGVSYLHEDRWSVGADASSAAEPDDDGRDFGFGWRDSTNSIRPRLR